MLSWLLSQGDQEEAGSAGLHSHLTVTRRAPCFFYIVTITGFLWPHRVCWEESPWSWGPRPPGAPILPPWSLLDPLTLEKRPSWKWCIL